MGKITKIKIGWEEWCALPDLGLPAVKAKIDTGAKTSSLHAYDIEPFVCDDIDYVRFKVHPLQGSQKIERSCMAPLIDRRSVTSSNGEREKRYVIKTRLDFSGTVIFAELTLTSRYNMAFRMLLGREAMRKARFLVDPAKSFLLGKRPEAKSLYLEERL